MAVFTKIFLTFPVKFWTDDVKDIFLASEERGKYSFWRPIKNDKGLNLVVCVVTGDEGRRLERLEEE